jgi:hypothetical protein
MITRIARPALSEKKNEPITFCVSPAWSSGEGSWGENRGSVQDFLIGHGFTAVAKVHGVRIEDRGWRIEDRE